MQDIIKIGNELLRVAKSGKEIQYSNNGGLSWFPRFIAASYTGDFKGIMDNGNEILAKTTQGLFYSTNRGSSWVFRSDLQ